MDFSFLGGFKNTFFTAHYAKTGRQVFSIFFFISFFIIFFSVKVNAGSHPPNPDYKLLSGSNFVQSKNYYLLTLFEELPDVKALLSADPILSSIARDKIADLSLALTTCNKEGLCYTGKMKFSEDEIKSIGSRLAALYLPDNALGKLVKNHLVPSGTYILFDSLSPKELLIKAWDQDAKGINYAIGVYAEGNKPNYPNIDSISFNTKDSRDNKTFLLNYVSLLYNTVSLVINETKNNRLFFVPSLSCALHFLEMNEREQASDFEPMAAGENKAAYNRIKTINWDNYKYSLILVPGAGPEERDVALSAEGILRCRLAALQYANGVAPFIVVSGGKVHPYKTRFCEATEMKKYMIERLHIPGNAIIIEPHARHTTTNMRNTVRIMFRNGVPFNKPGITCTTRGQSTMISNTLIERCMKELHEVPYKNGDRLSETEVEFYPLIEALQINPLEPIDP